MTNSWHKGQSQSLRWKTSTLNHVSKLCDSHLVVKENAQQISDKWSHMTAALQTTLVCTEKCLWNIRHLRFTPFQQYTCNCGGTWRNFKRSTIIDESTPHLTKYASNTSSFRRSLHNHINFIKRAELVNELIPAFINACFRHFFDVGKPWRTLNRNFFTSSQCQ